MSLNGAYYTEETRSNATHENGVGEGFADQALRAKGRSQNSHNQAKENLKNINQNCLHRIKTQKVADVIVSDYSKPQAKKDNQTSERQAVSNAIKGDRGEKN